MSYFSFIDDEDLVGAVSSVIKTAQNASEKAESEFEKNVLDPFAALFSMSYNAITLDEWNKLEKERQSQKSIQNAIGEFHQNLLGKFHGWQNPGRGGSVDLINDQKKFIAEIKNKHNTMNSSSAAETYNKLANHLKYDRKGYTAYLVQIVPKHAEDYDIEWSPNLTTTALRHDIRRIDGESFYDLASGEKDTMHRIYEKTPEIVANILHVDSMSDNTFQECLKLFDKVYK